MDLFASIILFDVAQYSFKIGLTHLHHLFIFRRVFDRQFLHDVVEISSFIPSSDPLPFLSPPESFVLMIPCTAITKGETPVPICSPQLSPVGQG